MDHLGCWIELGWLEMSMMMALIKHPIRIEEYAQNFILNDATAYFVNFAPHAS
jgi:hypothetical protein